MPEERDRPLPSWPIPSTSKAKHGARHTFPNPGPSRSAPLTAGPSRPSSSRSTQPIEIFSSDGDSDIAVLAPPTTAKERSAARQRHEERQEAPHRRHDSDSSEGRPLMKERSRRTNGTQTSRSSHRYALDPPSHKPKASSAAAREQTSDNQPTRLTSSALASASAASRLSDPGNPPSRSRARAAVPFAGDGTADYPIVLEDSPPPPSLGRLSNPIPPAPSKRARTPRATTQLPIRQSVPELHQAGPSRSGVPFADTQSHSRKTGILTPEATPAGVYPPDAPRSEGGGFLQIRSDLPGHVANSAEVTRCSAPPKPSQLPSSQIRPHPMAHLPLPSPTASHASLPSRFSSSPEKETRPERKGGSFGSHKKKLDPNRTVIGRTLSKEQALDEGHKHRMPASTPSGSRAVKLPPSSQRSASNAYTPRQGRPFHESPSLSPTKPRHASQLLGSSLTYDPALPDSPPTSLAAKKLDAVHGRRESASQRDAAASTLGPKKTVSGIKCEPNPSTSSKRYLPRGGPSSLKSTKVVTSLETSAKGCTESGALRTTAAASSAARVHSDKSSSSADTNSSRPKRARPAAGTYTVPGLEAGDWPSSSGSMGGQKKRKKVSAINTQDVKDASVSTNTAKRMPTRSASAVQQTPPRRSESVVTLGTPATPTPERVKREDSHVAVKSRSPSSSPLTEIESDDAPTPTKMVMQPKTDLPPVQEEAEEEDVAAFWADYNFSAPSPESANVEVAASTDPELALTSVKGSPLAPSATLADASGRSPRNSYPRISPVATPSKRRFSEDGCVHGSLSPSVKRRLVVNRSDRVAELLAAKEAAKQEALEKETRKIEQRLREAEDPSDDEDDDLEDIAAIITRQQRTGRNAEPAKQHAPSRPVVKKTKVKHVPTKLDKLVDQARRDAEAGLGDPDALLAEFARISPEKEDYLTSSENEASDALPGLETPQLDSVEVQAALLDLPVDADDMEVLRDVAEPEAAVEQTWSGFWTDSEPQMIPERGLCLAPILQVTGLRGNMLKRAVARKDLRGIALCLSRPGLENALHAGQNASVLAQWLLDMVDSGYAVLALCKLVAVDCGSPTFFSSCSLTSILLAVLFRFGMSPIVTDVERLPALPAVALDRDAACELVCAIGGAAAPYVSFAASEPQIDDSHAKTASVHGLDLAWVLLALATDETTSEPLIRAIDHALPPLWDLAMRTEAPVEVAAQIVGAASDLDLPMKAKARMVLRIGCRTEVQRDLARWVAIGLLMDSSIDMEKASPIAAKPKRPDIDLIIAGADTIYTALQAADPDHAAVRAQLILFTEACSDLHALIDESGGMGSAELDHLQELIMRAERSIVHKAFSKDKDFENKTRLGQLHTSLRRIEKTMAKRRERAKVARMKSLEEGPGGQLRLSLAKKPD